MKKFLTLGLLLSLPMVVSAANITDAKTLFIWIANLINVLAYTLISLAVVVFLFGVFRYLVSGADEEARKTGRTFMVWGIASLFIMVSVWGLVNIFKKTLILNDKRPATPQF